MKRWLLVACCSTSIACGSRPSNDAIDHPGGATSAGHEESSAEREASRTATQVRTSSNAPALTDEAFAQDAADPSLVVAPESGWVVVPSFRLAIAMPNGWYWSNAEEYVRLSAVTLDEAHVDLLHRSLQAIVNQFLTDDPSHAGLLIPSVRVLLLPGGLPQGGRLPDDFCDTVVIHQLRELFPDARLSSHSMQTIGGRPTVRCGVDHSVRIPAGTVLQTHSEIAMVFGESHVVTINAVCGDDSAAVLDEVLASARSL